MLSFPVWTLYQLLVFVCLLSFPQGQLFPWDFEIFDSEYTLKALVRLYKFPVAWFQIMSLQRSPYLHLLGNSGVFLA